MMISPARVATIFAADAANYSRAMSLDEQRALAALGASRKVIDAAIETRGGRIFSTGGDSVLAEFPAPNGAVACAVDVQRALARANAGGVETLPYRIGLHIGRVHPNGRDLLGETVNIAARLESLSYPGGVCLSDKVLDALSERTDLRIEGIGGQILKGIRDPVRAARIRLGEPDPAPETSHGFSLAVLPFQAPTQDRYWGEGLADDLIAALSRFSTLAVMSRASTFAFDPAQDPQRVASALGVRFVVTGAVRRSPSRLRLQAELVEGVSGRILWAARYDRAAGDALDVQDELIETIVATLAGRLEQTGAATASRKRPGSLGAFDFLMQGLHHADRLDPSSARNAIDCFERALAISPDYPAAMAMLALMRLRDWALHPGESDLVEAARLADRALTLDPADSWCHLVAGQMDMYRKLLDAAEVHHKKAYALNPYDARILALWSPLATYLGKPDEGRKRIEKAMALNPHHPAWYTTNLGLACYCSSAYADGAAIYASRRPACWRGLRPVGPARGPRRRSGGASRVAHHGAQLQCPAIRGGTALQIRPGSQAPPGGVAQGRPSRVNSACAFRRLVDLQPSGSEVARPFAGAGPSIGLMDYRQRVDRCAKTQMESTSRRRVGTGPHGQRRRRAYVATFRFGKVQPRAPAPAAPPLLAQYATRRDSSDESRALASPFDASCQSCPRDDRLTTRETGGERIGDEAIANPGVDPLALVTDGGGLRSGSRRLRLLDGCGLSPGSIVLEHLRRRGKLALENVVVAPIAAITWRRQNPPIAHELSRAQLALGLVRLAPDYAVMLGLRVGDRIRINRRRRIGDPAALAGFGAVTDSEHRGRHAHARIVGCQRLKNGEAPPSGPPPQPAEAEPTTYAANPRNLLPTREPLH
jgi:adenylate cyclase